MKSRNLNSGHEIMSTHGILNASKGKEQSRSLMFHSFEECLKVKGNNSFFLQTKEQDSRELWEIVFLAKYRPFLFSDISGVITLNDINIISADIRTWQEGSVAEISVKARILDDSNQDEKWENLKRDLEKIFTSKLSLTYRLNLKVLPSIPSNSESPSSISRVVVDNKSSDLFTVIHVFTQDKVGLLYKMTHTLTDLKLLIKAARISTERNHVADTFYVHNLQGKKVEEIEQEREIRRALLHQVRGA